GHLTKQLVEFRGVAGETRACRRDAVRRLTRSRPADDYDAQANRDESACKDSRPHQDTSRVRGQQDSATVRRSPEDVSVYGDPLDLTVTPAASRPARTLAASRSAPGVSPWTHRVSASTGTTVPSSASTTRSCTIRSARATAIPASSMTEPDLRLEAREPSGSYARSANASAATRSPAARPAFRVSEPGRPKR